MKANKQRNDNFAKRLKELGKAGKSHKEMAIVLMPEFGIVDEHAFRAWKSRALKNNPDLEPYMVRRGKVKVEVKIDLPVLQEDAEPALDNQ